MIARDCLEWYCFPAKNDIVFLPTDMNLLMQAGTVASRVGMETPEETLSRIASGRFGGADASVGNGTMSGGGNYSPPQRDDFPLDEIHMQMKYGFLYQLLAFAELSLESLLLLLSVL